GDDRGDQGDAARGGGCEVRGAGVAGVHQVPAGGHVTGDELVLDVGGCAHVRVGGRGRVHVGDQVRGVRVAGLGQVALAAHPLQVRFAPGGGLGAVAGIGIVGRVDALLGRPEVLDVLQAQTSAAGAFVLLVPDRAQDHDLGQGVHPGGDRVGVD